MQAESSRWLKGWDFTRGWTEHFQVYLRLDEGGILTDEVADTTETMGIPTGT